MDDPFENMREQMEKERDEFFKNVNPRDWPNDRERGSMFNRPRTSFGGFPGSSATLRPMRTNFPAEDEFSMSGHRSLPRTKHHDHDNLSDKSSGSSGGETDMGTPIRVIHERPVSSKQRYAGPGPRNTTQLPAKASTEGSESPRLERAASEPPNKFKQRLNLSSAGHTSAVPTIPEHSDCNNSDPRFQSTKQSHLADRNPIKTSASAPSVPGYYPDQSQPSAPPRHRSPPRAMSNQGQPGQPTNSSSNVRHIPIFVEGRPEPIFHQNLNTTTPAATAQQQQQQQQQRPASQELPFSKPSDYYPPGVQRVKSREDAVAVPEPTTPMGPPPGPIPMGYLPSQQQQQLLKPDQPQAEPTTPQGPPPGPIPMGYVPREQGAEESHCPEQTSPAPPVPPQRHRTSSQSQSQAEEQPRKISGDQEQAETGDQRRSSPVVNVVPIKLDQRDSASPVSQRNAASMKQDSPPLNPKIAKLEKIKEDVESLTSKIDNFQGSKTDKEYLYLEEMLTRHLIALDGIEPEGQTEIRQMRKESINSVNRCLSLLDRKVSDATTDAATNDQILSELVEKSNIKHNES